MIKEDVVAGVGPANVTAGVATVTKPLKPKVERRKKPSITFKEWLENVSS